MAKKKKSFFESIVEDAVYHVAMEAARDPVTGKVDPYAAAGIAFGSGKMKNFNDQMRLAAHLGAAVAFDPDENESAFDWRKYCEDGSEYSLDPEDYETENEYEEALEEAKYGWRDVAEDGSKYGLHPEDYETEDEYEEALEDVKCGWRSNAPDGSDAGIKPNDYESEEEYLEALSNVDGVFITPDEMPTYRRRRLEAQLCDMDYQQYMENVRHFRRFGIDPDDYENMADYFQTVSASLRDARKLKELIENNENSSVRKAAEKLFTIKYDFGIAFSDDDAKKKEIKRLERILKEYYTCEVPKFKKGVIHE